MPLDRPGMLESATMSMTQHAVPEDARPLRIEVVTDTFPPDVNGVAMTLGRFASGLRARGHTVEIVRPGRHEEGFVGTPWWPLPGYWEIRVGAPWPRQLYRRWKKTRPDVIYIAIESPLGFSAMRAAKHLGIPMVGGYHTRFRHYLRLYGMPRFAESVWKYQRWFHSRMQLTLAPSPDARKELIEGGFQHVEVLGRGVDCSLFHPDKRDHELRRTWGAGDESIVAIVVGRVSAEKNIQLAIRAFDHLRATNPDSHCVVIGDGPARERLQLENPHVLFAGYRHGEALAACYASADLLLFPSETETFGNVLLEGMASGLAVLAYDAAAAKWLGTDGVDCLKAPLGQADAYIDCALRLSDASLRRNLSLAARKTAESQSWSSIISSLTGHFRSCLKGR